MEDLRSILTSHHSKSGSATVDVIKTTNGEVQATTSEIPDLFFDEILINIKLTRTEVLLLMYLYRITWCKPNLHRKYGIAPILSHTELAKSLDVTNEVLYQTIRSLEGFNFIETIRAGQYFVRKYFSEENDRKYGQTYDNFL
ncbi:MAG: hypothetical protein HON90_16860 [Halobacteriovoraceae bacterium]|jgi:DNA-binding MarR family transcriptional regulator|nr:hypothetical protein [Halobacteriovoraceae bacterium]